MSTYLPMRLWPHVSHNPSDIERLYGKPAIGLDLEWDGGGNPSILGLSDGQLHVSVPYQDGRDRFLYLVKNFPKTILVGHNIVGADISVLEKAGIVLPLENVEDTIIRHWLVNMHLSKMKQKGALEEDDDAKRGAGFNNLWTMASLYTSFPHWKDCRLDSCEGPCPIHDEYGYNGLDAAAPVIALPQLKRIMLLRGVEKLYPMHRKLAWRLNQMRDAGVRIDMPYVATLTEEFDRDKKLIADGLEFNPDSNPQVLKYFQSKFDIKLDNAQEQTIRDKVDDLGEDDAPDELIALLDYKELGNGPDRWFKPVYKDKRGYLKGFMDTLGYVHPRIGFYTSSARMMSSSPNFQNVAKRRQSRKVCECGHFILSHDLRSSSCSGFGCKTPLHKFKGESIGKKIRRAIIAPEGYYIVRADYSNAEGRTVLYLAGYESPKVDMHSWMRDNIGLVEDEPFSRALGGAREAAKSVTHASNYLEGLQLKTKWELKSDRIRKEIAEGARLVYPDWTFKDKIVTLTGVNLSRRAFGAATLENRRKANEVVSRYIDKAFPDIRKWQQKVTKQIENEGMVRPPHGYVLLSYGASGEDQIKQAVATWGQQPTAHFSKLAIVDLYDKYDAGQPMRPILQVHDELLTYVPDSVDPKLAMQMLKESMEKETPEMPGFIIPSEASYGPNWRDQTKEGK